jgi:hypothetical protein
VLADAWAPMFAIVLGIDRDHLLDMSVPEMVDHVDYWSEMRSAADG